jgi:predicted phosphodiesterase
VRYAVISDIHANPAALRGVLKAINNEGVDRIVCLGDIVGIHASPGECIDMLIGSSALCLAGNHDEGVRGTLDQDRFPPVYWKIILRTREQLTPGQMAFLRGLPTMSVIDDGILIMHGTLDRSYRYLVGPAKLRAMAVRMRMRGIRYAFYGHTHREACHRLTGRLLPLKIERLEPSGTADLGGGGHYLINPGTVGDPRTSDKRAKYALFDTVKETLHLQSVVVDSGDVVVRSA